MSQHLESDGDPSDLGQPADAGKRPDGGALSDQYQILFAANPLPLWVYDLESLHIVDVNQAASEKYGYSRTEFLKLSVADLRPPEDVTKLELAVRTMRVQSSGSSSQWRHRLSDGTLIDVDVTSREVQYKGRRARLVCPVDITQRLRAEAALFEREAGLRRAQSLAKLGHIITRQDGSFESWSESLPELIGIGAENIPSSTREWLQLLHPDDREAFRLKVIEAAVTGERIDVTYRIPHVDGSWRHMRQFIEPIGERQPGLPQRWFSTMQDVTEQVRAEFRMRRLNRVHAVLSGINTLIVRVRGRDELFREACRIAVEAGAFRLAWIALIDPFSLDGHVVATFGSTENTIGSVRVTAREGTASSHLPGSRAILDKMPVICNNIASSELPSQLRDHLLERGYRSAAWLPLLIDGEAIGVVSLHADEAGAFDDEEIKLLLELAGDISFALDHLAKDERLTYLAHYDAVTGLANNALLRERLAHYLARSADHRMKLAVAVIDIQRFKMINETLGRAAGDSLLRQVGERLAESVTDSRHLAHIGADQFALIVPDVHAEIDLVHSFHHRLRSGLGPPFEVEGRELRIAARVGIALYPTDGLDAETLLRNAEAALRKAKANAEQVLFYNPRMTEAVAEKLALETKLRQALENDEFVLHYQPKVELPTRRIVALEALIRWRSPELGLVPPGRFIPMMEETGLIHEVGWWALRQAACDRKRWVDAGTVAPRIAVNVSAVQLRKPDFVATVASALASGAVPHGIDIEITESLIMEDIEGTVTKLHALRGLGIDLSIDDFGTGYSSLAYLAKLPVQTLKIDRAFVATMIADESSMTLVSTMISLAHALRLGVVAEGVETEAEARMLDLLRCDQIQGYLISKPLPFEAISAMLHGQAPSAST